MCCITNATFEKTNKLVKIDVDDVGESVSNLLNDAQV